LPGFLVWLYGGVCAAALAASGAEPWTFERVLRHALTNSPDARIALHRIAAAEGAARQADAALWPTVQLESSYAYTDNPMRAFGAILNQRQFSPFLDFNDVPGADNFNVRAGLVYPLYSGGRTAAGREASQAGALAARHGADAVRDALAFEVARTFHTTQKARAFVQATSAGVEAFATNAGLAQRRFQAGALLKSELLDVEVRLAQAREDLVRARNAHALSIRALRNLLGIEGGDFEVDGTAVEVPIPAGESPGRRAELSAAAERERSGEAEVRSARGGYRPRVSLVGVADYDHGWRFNGGGDSYTAGAVVQWDVWDGQLTRARVSQARAGLDAVREETRKLRLAVDLEVEQARLALAGATERLQVTATAIEQASESVALTRSRFEQGLALAAQLIDAETALTAARVRRAEAEADRQIAIAALRRALGEPQLPELAELH
jgi:outer membrane protein TolC